MSFQIGDLVWAKMKGYPPWPGLITEPPDELKKTASRAKTSFSIYFFGTKNYSWIETANLKPYEQNKENLVKIPKNNGFITAMKEIEEFKLGNKSIVVTPASAPSNQLIDQNTPPKKPKRSETGKKKGSVSNDSSNHLKQPDVSPNETSTVNSSKKTPVKAPRRSTIKQERKSDEVPRRRSLSNKRSNTSPVNVIKSKRRTSELLNGGIGDEDTCSSVEQQSNGRLSPSSLLPSTSKYDPPLNKRLPASISHAKSTSKNLIQSNSEGQGKMIIPSDLNFGFVGAGNLAARIVEKLLKKGHKMSVWSSSPEKSVIEEFGAEMSETPGAVVMGSDVTFCCASDAETAEKLVYGYNGVLGQMSEGKALIEMSCLDTELSQAIAEAVDIRGGRYLEVHLQPICKDGDESLMVLAAGDKSLYNECETCFTAFAKHSTFLGEVGSAVNMNSSIQLTAGILLGGVSEGLALAKKCGISLPVLIEALKRSQLNCHLLIDSCKAVVEDKFIHSSRVSRLEKDVQSILNVANSSDQEFHVGSVVNDCFKRAKES